MKSAEVLLAGKSGDMITASPDQTVREALRLMFSSDPPPIGTGGSACPGDDSIVCSHIHGRWR